MTKLQPFWRTCWSVKDFKTANGQLPLNSSEERADRTPTLYLSAGLAAVEGTGRYCHMVGILKLPKSNSWNSENLLCALLAHAVFWMLWMHPTLETNNSECSSSTVRALKQEENTNFLSARYKVRQHRTPVFMKTDLEFFISAVWSAAWSKQKDIS